MDCRVKPGNDGIGKGRERSRPFYIVLTVSFPGLSAARSFSRCGALQSRGPGNDGVRTEVPALRSGMKNAAPRPGHGASLRPLERIPQHRIIRIALAPAAIERRLVPLVQRRAALQALD